MKKFIKIYENDAKFHEIMEICKIDDNIDNWEYYSTGIGGEHGRPLIGKTTNCDFGWLVYKQDYDEETGEITQEKYIAIAGELNS